MTARILDGRELAGQLRRDLGERVGRLSVDGSEHTPRLAIIRSGGSESAAMYAASLERAARGIGIQPRLITDEDGPLDATIDRLNADDHVAGIVIATPLPDPVEGARLVERIDPLKDVDGATPTNAGWLARGEPAFVPATALAVIALLEAYGVPVAGRRAVIIGRSAVVGRPVASALVARDATVVICHRATRDLATETSRAEILVAAAGVPGLVGPEMVGSGAVVVDCGINTVASGVTGDVEFATVAPIAGAITPVPGGIGPVTPMMVLRQTVEAAERARRASA
ncbi:MAG: bifunctional 5,10-methylenetetrahydrofolate dehydrogenase/5,10-methenyltetrahydrofolate cyclohydrolase [Candidatus Limnocylindria bacterium]